MTDSPQRFNASGSSGRDCPMCFRPGSLTGARMDGAPMECSGCFACFTFTAATDTAAATLTRLPAFNARRRDFDARR